MAYSHRLRQGYLQMADAFLDAVAHTPGGYTWLVSLPTKGRYSSHNLRKRLATLLEQAFFPADLLHAMVAASVSVDGIPDNRGRKLYTWLVKIVYDGHEERLYTDWCMYNRQRKDK